jgi:hypothetical protein
MGVAVSDGRVGLTFSNGGRTKEARFGSVLAGCSIVLGVSTLLLGMASGPVGGPGLAAGSDSVRTILPGLLGQSGNLLAITATAQRAVSNPALRLLLAPLQNLQPGVHRLGATAPDGDAFSFLALIPFRAKEGARLGGYDLGFWPSESGRKGSPALPEGFIEVTRTNIGTPVSKHFRLGDFLTHDQQGVWPKYMVLQPALLDKLELIASALERAGLASKLHVMSGFRTPQYNAKGVGPLGGRARDSRHMYGDAADVFVDADGNGMMDDLNGDGRISLADARLLQRIAGDVEASHPALVGGLGLYRATSAHGPFVHVDARGHRARW